MKKLLFTLLIAAPFLGFSQPQGRPTADTAKQQPPIELISAAELEMMKQQGVEARYLRSSDSIPVVFEQGDMRFRCKEAIQFPDSNFVAAFGDIYIQRGDSIELKGDTLLYYGNERFAEMRQNVYFTDQIIEMESPYANYDMIDDIATYQYGAVITDTTSTLTSRRGYYYTRRKLLAFRGNVVLDNPKDQYNIETDTLTYNTQTQTAYFHTKTEIDSKDGSILAQKGEYQTAKGKSYFRERVELENQDYIMSADRLNYDEQRQAGNAKGRVKMFNKKDSITIYGDISNFDGEKSYLEVFGNGLVEKPFGRDTLFMAADTLRSMRATDSTEAKNLLAYSNVRLFSKQLEGICDSLSYQTTDSLIEFFHDPVMWTNKSQLTADTLIAYLLNEEIDQLRMRKNAFIISEDSIQQYDQVKGRNMLAQFRNDYLKQVDVNGNGQSIYFALEKGQQLMGMNRVDCSSMIMRFQGKNELEEITFIKNPEAKFIPPHELKPKQLRLPDFTWRIEQRPGRALVDSHAFRSAIAKPKTASEQKIIPRKRPPKLRKEQDLLTRAEAKKQRLELEKKRLASLEKQYGQRIADKGFEVFLKGNQLTFYLERPSRTRARGFYYVDTVPVNSESLSPADRERGYETREAQAQLDELGEGPFVLQLLLPEYPYYTLRFGQYTVQEDNSKNYRWTEAWNK